MYRPEFANGAPQYPFVHRKAFRLTSKRSRLVCPRSRVQKVQLERPKGRSRGHGQPWGPSNSIHLGLPETSQFSGGLPGVVRQARWNNAQSLALAGCGTDCPAEPGMLTQRSATTLGKV